MPITRDYEGRIIVESEYFQPEDRRIAGLARNHVWLYTVERGTELERDTGRQSNKTVVRIVRWQARNGDNSEEKFWRYRSSYNVRSTEEWEATSTLVDNFLEGKTQTDSFVALSPEEYEKLYADSQRRKSEKRKLTAMIRDLKNTFETERELFKQKLLLMRSRMQDLEYILSEYKKLISDANTTETNLQEFLVKHDAFWMFGLEYICIKPKVRFPHGKKDYEFDLMLQRYDHFWDLVELKGPNENLFDKRTSKRSKPNEKLSEAVSQVFTYLYAIDKRKWSDKVVKPKAYIVIGKDKTDRPTERRIFSSYLSNVELITHSELYGRGMQLLKHVKDKTLT